VVDGTVYVGSEEHVYAVDTASGTEQWRFQAESSVEYSSPAVVDGTVYVGCERNVYALEGVDGTEQWRFQTYGVGSPVVVDGTVYVGSRSPRVDDTVYALSAAEGTEQWTFQTVGTVRSSLAVIDGTIYVGSRDNVEGGRRGTVYALGGEQLGTNTKVYSDSLCSNCGTDLSDHGDPNFCPECGAETDISEKSKTQVFDQ